MTESGHLPPKETDEQRLPWHRRPRTLLAAPLACLIAAVPFAIRGYQLSAIPDIADPFTDVPPTRSLPNHDIANRSVSEFQKRMDRLEDDAFWLAIEEPTEEQQRQFNDAIWSAVRKGLEDSPLPVIRFADENDDLIDEWHQILVSYSKTPPKHDMSRTVNHSRILNALKLASNRRIQTGKANDAFDILAAAFDLIEQLTPRNRREFIAIQWAKQRLLDDVVRASEHPSCTQQSLSTVLVSSNSWQPMSTTTRLALLKEEYEQTIDVLNAQADSASSSGSWGARQFLFILGEPEISHRIVKQLYAGYRSQLAVPHSMRVQLISVASGGIEWFDGTGSPELSRFELATAFTRSPLLENWKLKSPGAVFAPTLLQSFDRDVAQMNHMRVTFACQLYLREHASLPDSFDALVPDYLPVVPEDPLTKSEPNLLLRNDGRSVVVYSRGWNGRDDGGPVDTAPESDWHGDDFGILIRDLINHPEQAEGSEKVE